MSIRPVRFNADGSVDVLHDDALGGAHTGTIAAADVGFLPVAGGGHDHRFTVLPCPVAGCGSVTTHPVGGGAAAAAVQELFVRLAARVGCPCGLVAAGAALATAQAHMRLQTSRMDGATRWSIVGQIK